MAVQMEEYTSARVELVTTAANVEAAYPARQRYNVNGVEKQ
jgi:hypothetical protein